MRSNLTVRTIVTALAKSSSRNGLGDRSRPNAAAELLGKLSLNVRGNRHTAA